MTDAEKREKVIKGLECCKTIHPDCDHCPYFNTDTERLGRAMCKAAGRPDDDLDMFCLALLHCDALALLKAQEPAVAYWIHCGGKSHIWYCSKCGEKINYNDARRTYKTEKKPVEAVNRYCRGCGATMVPRPTEAQREATPWN